LSKEYLVEGVNGFGNRSVRWRTLIAAGNYGAAAR